MEVKISSLKIIKILIAMICIIICYVGNGSNTELLKLLKCYFGNGSDTELMKFKYVHNDWSPLHILVYTPTIEVV